MWIFVDEAHAHRGMLWFNHKGRLHAALPEDVIQIHIGKTVQLKMHQNWINRYQEAAST